MISAQTYTLENYRLKQQEMIDIPRENWVRADGNISL